MELTTRQNKALEALMRNMTLADVATHAGVTVQTVSKWLKQEEFVDRLHYMQSAVIEQAVSLMASEAREVFRTFAEIHRNSENRPSDRVAAGRALTSDLLKIREQVLIVEELKAIRERLDELEQ